MTTTREEIRHFVISAIHKRLKRQLPPAPADLEDLASKVAEGLIFLGYLPLVFHRQSISEGEEKQPNYQEIVEVVASEVYVAVSEYFNGNTQPPANFPLNAARFHFH